MAVLSPHQMFAERYRIERLLGEGGFGAVYEATELGVERRVAIKVLKPDDGRGYKPATKARFEREARAVGNLQSAHTVTLLDFGESDGKLFMVFEMVPGEDLRVIIDREERLDPRTAVHILRQLLDSLGEAHRAGVLHRDIKPANIRAFAWGDNPMFVKLLDFGLARPTDDGSPGITTTGEIVGTPRYMSPEQLSATRLTPASDIYSLGIVFLEMLVGAAPLQGNRWADQFDRMMSGHVFSVPEQERIGPRLVQIINEMTARDATDRFQSAVAVLAALDRPDELGTVTDERAARPPRTALIAAAIFVLGLLTIGVLTFIDDPTPGPPPDPRPANVSALLSPPSTEPAGCPVRHDAGLPPVSDDAGATADLFPPPAPDAGTPGCTVNQIPEDLTVYEPLGYEPRKPHPLVIVLPRDLSTQRMNLRRPQREGEEDGEARRQRDRPYLEQSRHQFLKGTQLFDSAERHQTILLVPRVGRAWTEWHADKVVADYHRVASSLCVDRNRVFVIGDFNGGDLATKLQEEDWVTAVAVYAFLPEASRRDQIEDWSKPTIWLSPTNSDQMPTSGWNECVKERRLPLSEVEVVLRERNRCSGEEVTVLSEGDGQCMTWSCEVPFWSCQLRGGYEWPGGNESILWSWRKPTCGAETRPTFQIEDTIFGFFVDVVRRQRN